MITRRTFFGAIAAAVGGSSKLAFPGDGSSLWRFPPPAVAPRLWQHYTIWDTVTLAPGVPVNEELFGAGVVMRPFLVERMAVDLHEVAAEGIDVQPWPLAEYAAAIQQLGIQIEVGAGRPALLGRLPAWMVSPSHECLPGLMVPAGARVSLRVDSAGLRLPLSSPANFRLMISGRVEVVK